MLLTSASNNAWVLSLVVQISIQMPRRKLLRVVPRWTGGGRLVVEKPWELYAEWRDAAT